MVNNDYTTPTSGSDLTPRVTDSEKQTENEYRCQGPEIPHLSGNNICHRASMVRCWGASPLGNMHDMEVDLPPGVRGEPWTRRRAGLARVLQIW